MTKFTAAARAGFAAVVLVTKGGAVKGAVVGGVAGHMMGGHAKTGAVVGAIAGHHERAKSQARINAGGQP